MATNLGQLGISAMTNLSLPPHLTIDVRSDYEGLMKDVGRRAVGFDGVPLFGTAFVQGGRLQFTTAIPLKQMLEISDQHRAKRGANVQEVLAESNRAREPAHEKRIADYLQKTACVGEKWIMPSFTFNFGTVCEDETSDVLLILLDGGHDGSTTWPGVLLLPRSAKVETTDGAHRRNTMIELLASKKLSPEARELLLNNAVDIKLVFEDSLRDSHQDFADCGQTKPIAQATLAAYDVRQARNRIATNLAKTHPFLQEYVDATSNSVNLSGKSHRAWSLSAVRTLVEHVIKSHPVEVLTDDLKLQNLDRFLDALIGHMPQLKALEANRLARIKDPKTESITGDLREVSGGDVALRAVGLFIFARAYVYCAQKEMSFTDMAMGLASLNWGALTCGRNDIPAIDDPNEYAKAVMDKANPLWRDLLAVKARRYKIMAANAEADKCWIKVTTSLFTPQAQAAE